MQVRTELTGKEIRVKARRERIRNQRSLRRDWLRLHREEIDGHMVSTMPEVNHGTLYAYNSYGCHCSKCRAIMTEMRQKERKRAEMRNTIPAPVKTATTYSISCLPLDHEAAHHFTIWVEWRGNDKWCVRDGFACYDINGDSEYESLSSNRTDEYLTRFRFDLPTALKLARKLAPKMTVNGHTVADALEN